MLQYININKQTGSLDFMSSNQISFLFYPTGYTAIIRTKLELLLRTCSVPSVEEHTPTYMKINTHLADADGVVQHGFGVGSVVAAGQLCPAEVGLHEQVCFGVRAVVRVRVDLQGEMLGPRCGARGVQRNPLLPVNTNTSHSLLCLMSNIHICQQYTSTIFC